MEQLCSDSDKDRRALTLVEMLGAIFLVLIIGAILFPVFTQSTNGGRSPVLRNIKQLALGNLMYAADNDDRLPIARRWMDAVSPHLKNDQLFVDPGLEDRQEDEYGFAFFQPLSGAKMGAVADPGTIPLLFQSSLLHRNAASDLSTRRTTDRGMRLSVAFLDGHAKFEPLSWPEQPIVLRFEPGLDQEEETGED